MPIIEIKTNVSAAESVKRNTAKRFQEAFRKAGEPMCADNLTVVFYDNAYISFRGEDDAPAAVVTINPGPLTPEEDYRPIVDDMFAVMNELIPDIKNDRIYMTVSEISHWGFGGKYL